MLTTYWHSPKTQWELSILKSRYILKGVGEPEYYLGGNIDVASTCIKNVVNKLKQLFGKAIMFARTPMTEAYHPKMDETPLLDPGEARKFRTLTGSTNWVITLGRFDIAYSTMALEQILHGSERRTLEGNDPRIWLPQTMTWWKTPLWPKSCTTRKPCQSSGA